MSPEFWTLAGVTVTTGGAIWIQMMALRQQDRKDREALAERLLADAVKKDKALDTIHVLVNSRLAEALAKIDALEKEVAQLNLSKL